MNEFTFDPITAAFVNNPNLSIKIDEPLINFSNCDSSAPSIYDVPKEKYDSIAANNTYMPSIKRVIYNLKTEKTVIDKKGEKKTVKLDHPVMTTTVLFDDNTSTTVQNSPDDVRIKLDDVEIAGKTIQTASRNDKETALVYAIVKRLACVPGKNGKCAGGFGKILSELVDKAYDQPVAEAQAAADRKAKKTAFEKEKKEREERPKRYTVDEVLQILGPYLEKLVKNEADPKTVLLAEAAKKPAVKKTKKSAVKKTKKSAGK